MLGRGARIVGVTILFVAAAMTILLWKDRELRYTLWAELTHDIGAPDETWTAEPVNTSGLTARFAVAGDIGTGEPPAKRTGEVMGEFSLDRPFDAVLLLGDNSYPDGDAEQINRTVFEPLAPVLGADTELHAVLGNHDVRNSNGPAQVAALGMPGSWYTVEVANVQLIALDSTRPDDPEQLAFLREQLELPNPGWRVAMMHHPPYSGGYHGWERETRDAFVPLFEQYGVDLVLSGHDHDYQRSEEIGGVTYVVSGGAAHLRPANKADFTEVAWSTLHFVDLWVYDDRIEGRAIDQEGRVFDQFVLMSA